MKRTDYAYTITPETLDHLEPNANAVMIAIEPGSATEPVHVVSDITMHVRATAGEGELVVHAPDGERRIHSLRTGLGAIAIGAGDTYQYLHTGSWQEPLQILDVCSPAFVEGDEVSLLPIDPTYRPQAGDYLVLWSQREPREAHLAGAWRITVLEEHETTEYNRAHADLRGFRGDPPHWHALAQRAGEVDIWPVNLRVIEGRYELTAHRESRDARGGNPPSFAMQPNPTVFRRVDPSV